MIAASTPVSWQRVLLHFTLNVEAAVTNRQRLATLMPSRDQVMLASLATVAAIEIINWRHGSTDSYGGNGTISRLTRITFGTHAPEGRATFLAALGIASVRFGLHIVKPCSSK